MAVNPEADRPDVRGPKSDAPFTWIRRRFFQMIHAAVLAGLVALLVYAPANQLLCWDRRDMGRVIVRIVAALEEIRSPTEGEFVATVPQINGDRVVAGQTLGIVKVRDLQTQIAASQRLLDAHHRRKLLVDAPADGEELLYELQEREREFRQIAMEIMLEQSRLERLRRLADETVIVSPVDGRIQYGLPASKAVRVHETIVSVARDGGQLWVEVEGPLTLVHDVVRAGEVRALFTTHNTSQEVVAVPIPSSVRTWTVDHDPSKPKELWGSVQCQPAAIPDPLRVPGLMGRLR